MDEMCLEMCKITRWERGYRLILDRVDFSVHKKEKVLIRGKIQEDTRQMFQVASGVTAVQDCRCLRKDITESRHGEG